MTRNALAWFEIPTRDLERARRFYEQMLGAPLQEERMGPHRIAVFPYAPGQGVGGSLIAADGPGANVAAPARDGTIVYLPSNGALPDTLDRAVAAGAQVELPVTVLPGDIGSIAIILDPEGNRVGIHAPS